LEFFLQKMKLFSTAPIFTPLILASPFPDLPEASYPGTCPNVLGSQNFDLGPYITGTWFTAAQSQFKYTYDGEVCISASYYASSDDPNNKIDVYNSFLWKTTTGPRYTQQGYAVIDTEKYGTLSVTFHGEILEDDIDNYIVLDTDNNNYSYVWACQQYEDYYSPILWILNKNRGQSESEVSQQITSAIDILRDDFDWVYADEFMGLIDVKVTENCPDVDFQ